MCGVVWRARFFVVIQTFLVFCVQAQWRMHWCSIVVCVPKGFRISTKLEVLPLFPQESLPGPNDNLVAQLIVMCLVLRRTNHSRHSSGVMGSLGSGATTRIQCRLFQMTWFT